MTAYASVKKVSLQGLSEGWDESCFAYVTPANFKERLESVKLEDDSHTDDERLEFQEALIRKHFVSGRIKAFDGRNFSDAELNVEAAVELPDVSNKLTMFVLGYDIDPKELSKEVTPTLPTDTPTTETSSSEVSPETSQEPSQTNSSASDTKID